MTRLNQIIQADAQETLRILPPGLAQAVIADPPYYRVVNASWDNQWASQDDYLDWTLAWVDAAMRVLRNDGLLFLFGQRGKREHVFIHVASALCRQFQYHDTVIWDRVVGYNTRRESFDPALEEILVLRKSDSVKFHKARLRIPYPPDMIERYARDKRYTDPTARRRHLEQGKYYRNILSVPSLRGSSREKCGHPTQKPVALIKDLVLASTNLGDIVLDPFFGSGTTGVTADSLGRRWLGIEQDPRYVKMAEQRLAQGRAVKTFLPARDK
jgi:DNA modification methylase